jgi:PEP-CTERM motif-containing protein
LDVTIWSNQSLVFNYYFPDFGDVFTGSPISFDADGSEHLSTLSTLSPATFSVTSIAPDTVQIAYFYASGAFSLNTAPFNGFNISGPPADSPIVAAFVDSGSTAIGLTDGTVSFAADSVTVNLAGDQFPAGSTGLIDVQFAVPEPGSLLLLASALVVVFGIARLKRFRSIPMR